MNKTSDPAQKAFQKSDVSLSAINSPDLLLSRTNLTSYQAVSRPVRAVSDFFYDVSRPSGRPGRAPLREAPTTLGSEMQRKIIETGLSKTPFL